MFRRFALVFSPFLLAQCAWKSQQSPPKPVPVFHINQERYDALQARESRIKIDLVEQKAQLIDADDTVVLETDVSTGKPGHVTPTGTFKIMEKIQDKRSNRYGRYKDKSGLDLGASADLPKPPKDAVYEGYSMPYWMRLTWDGVGIHVGSVVPRSAVSFGCIRVPESVQPLIYKKCRVGTVVKITGSPGPDRHPPR